MIVLNYDNNVLSYTYVKFRWHFKKQLPVYLFLPLSIVWWQILVQNFTQYHHHPLCDLKVKVTSIEFLCLSFALKFLGHMSQYVLKFDLRINVGQWSLFHSPVILPFFFFFFFWFGFYGPFKNISLISSRSFIKGRQKPENPRKDHLTIRKQNLAFPHVTQARLEPQRWETYWIKGQLSYPLSCGGPQFCLISWRVFDV